MCEGGQAHFARAVYLSSSGGKLPNCAGEIPHEMRYEKMFENVDVYQPSDQIMDLRFLDNFSREGLADSTISPMEACIETMRAKRTTNLDED